MYQDLVVPLAEPCQTLLGIVWGGLLLLGRATQKSHPLYLVSRGRRHRSSCHRQSPCGVYSRCIWVAGVWWGARCCVPHFGRIDGRGSLCNQLRRAPSPPRERVPTMRPALQSQVCIYSRSTLDVSGAYAAFRGTVCGQRYRIFTTTAEDTAAGHITVGPRSLVAAP
jgi:hypothetical protein